MLHILLLILKIIGIILAVILGILILLTCIVLFVPVRYEAAGRCEGSLASLEGRVCVTWLLRLIRADVHYSENQLKWRLRILWIKKNGDNIKEEEFSHEEGSTEESHEEKAESAEVEKLPESKEEIPEARRQVEEEPKECEEDRKESVETVSQAESGDHEGVKDAEAPQESDEKGKKLWGKIREIFEKIKQFFRKLKESVQNIRNKTAELGEKKDMLADFLTDETHVGAFQRGKKECFKLLKRLSPKKLLIKARFGFSDPCLTGQVLAGLSILYPFMEEHMDITPDFENQVLEGYAMIKGRIYAVHFLVLCWNLIWSRNVRRTYKDIKNFRLKVGGNQ
ncbi:MAG: DUF2953 domain-containing protein [Lachnospiraceae bacterium]